MPLHVAAFLKIKKIIIMKSKNTHDLAKSGLISTCLDTYLEKDYYCFLGNLGILSISSMHEVANADLYVIDISERR